MNLSPGEVLKLIMKNSIEVIICPTPIHSETTERAGGGARRFSFRIVCLRAQQSTADCEHRSFEEKWAGLAAKESRNGLKKIIVVFG